MNGRDDPAERLGEGGRRMAAAGVDSESLRFVTRREYHVSCNWKVFCDNYLDGGYHVPFAHPALADGVAGPSQDRTLTRVLSLTTL